jgi:hypothetical protein
MTARRRDLWLVLVHPDTDDDPVYGVEAFGPFTSSAAAHRFAERVRARIARSGEWAAEHQSVQVVLARRALLRIVAEALDEALGGAGW